MLPLAKVNYNFIMLLVLTMTLNQICMAWSNTANNYSINVYKAMLEWNDEPTEFYKWLFNILDHGGKVVGAYMSTWIIRSGRRDAYI